MATLAQTPVGFPTVINSHFRYASVIQGSLRRNINLPNMKRVPRDIVPPPPRSPPRASQDWKGILSLAKSHYASRRFHQCFALCEETLNTIKPLSNIEPAYLIYLNFYAANALEAQAQGMHQGPSSRCKLLSQAREYYERASALLGAEESINARPSWRAACPTPDLHSPVGSTCSRSTISSRASSPDSSILSAGKSPARHKKRVTFQDDPIVEPIVRPDSPTLGFDEWLGGSSPVTSSPEPFVRADKSPPLTFSSSPDSSPLTPIIEEQDTTDPFLLVRSVHRYCTILTDLQRQIKSHIAAVDAEIATSQEPRYSLPESEELRALELKTRIERLRANGWRRPRFDATKYERLREVAVADLVG
ncbi:hypothetical protein HJFPF1_03046 [Paramyrothecium foliicola]|nr:hypothetical protein HJFPF1_03046 [Paramyrothecium foliicola]